MPNIKQSLVYVAQQESKLPTLIQYLISPTGYNAPIIVFTSTQARAASLLSELLLAGVKNAEALHAGLTRHEREQCMKRMLQGEIWVLVTTDVLARGMDFGGVQEVINFDWPESVQSYVHRVGPSDSYCSRASDLFFWNNRKDGACRSRRQSDHLFHG